MYNNIPNNEMYTKISEWLDIYHATDRLYKICSLLDPEQFIRISNSVVIAKDKVQRIAPSLFMKFILTMSDGTNVDVTRSYYYIFKEHFNI